MKICLENQVSPNESVEHSRAYLTLIISDSLNPITQTGPDMKEVLLLDNTTFVLFYMCFKYHYNHRITIPVFRAYLTDDLLLDKIIDQLGTEKKSTLARLGMRLADAK